MTDVPHTPGGPPRQHWSLPSWGIFAIGAVATGAALIWSSSLHDPITGDGLIDEPMANILIGLIGTTGTVMAVLLQRIGDVRHQVKNDHGTNFRDDLDDARSEIAQVRELAQHAVRAARKASDDTVQLREDVQAGRLETGEVRSDLRGLRKDIGRLADIITKGTTP